jgi:Flp pilus assembly protein TadB
MNLVAEETPEPLAQEIRRTYSEWKLGMPWADSLNNFVVRIPLLEIRLFVAAVVLHGRSAAS